MEERNIGGIATKELKELILVWTCGGVVWQTNVCCPDWWKMKYGLTFSEALNPLPEPNSCIPSHWSHFKNVLGKCCRSSVVTRRPIQL